MGMGKKEACRDWLWLRSVGRLRTSRRVGGCSAYGFNEKVRRIFMSGGVRIENGLCQFIAGGRGAANLSCLPFSQRLKAGMC